MTLERDGKEELVAVGMRTPLQISMQIAGAVRERIQTTSDLKASLKSTNVLLSLNISKRHGDNCNVFE